MIINYSPAGDRTTESDIKDVRVEWAGGTFTTRCAQFGAQQVQPSLHDVELILAEPLSACESLETGTVEGKIVLIQRGSCAFATKALHAQNAGAVAAIIYNNQDGEPAMAMENFDDATGGPIDERLTILTISASYADGIRLAAAVGQGTTIISLHYDENSNGTISEDEIVPDTKRWAQGDLVEYYSASAGGWIDAVVERDQSNESVDLDVRSRADPVKIRPRMLKPWVPAVVTSLSEGGEAIIAFDGGELSCDISLIERELDDLPRKVWAYALQEWGLRFLELNSDHAVLVGFRCPRRGVVGDGGSGDNEAGACKVRCEEQEIFVEPGSLEFLPLRVDPSISHEGWLEKMSPSGVWQRRWFCLMSGELHYSAAPDKSRKGTIKLCDCVSVSSTPSDQLVLRVFVDRDGVSRMYYVKCENATARTGWIASLHRAIGARLLKPPQHAQPYVPPANAKVQWYWSAGSGNWAPYAAKVVERLEVAYQGHGLALSDQATVKVDVGGGRHVDLSDRTRLVQRVTAEPHRRRLVQRVLNGCDEDSL